MREHTWAIHYDGKIKLFYDYYRAVQFYHKQDKPWLYHRLASGEWELQAWPGEVSNTVRAKQEKMNRETLVEP